MELNGHYAGLIKEQLAEDEINLINEENKKMNLSEDIIDTQENNNNSLSNENKKIIEDEDETLDIHENNLVNIKDEKTEGKIDRKRLWKLLSDHKCDLLLGTISGLLYGSVAPFVGVVLGYAINYLSIKDQEKIKTETFIMSMSFILFGVFGGIAILFKIWKLQVLGSVISSKMKKKVIKKYLELHMGFFDINTNSPGALITKLSIDTAQLDSLILNIVGGIVTVISTYLISIILGLQYDWKITLILSLFVPISVYGNMKKGDYEENGTERNKKSQIEAGSFLSECVINTKTIFSFNFQKPAVDMYLGLLLSESSDYVTDSIWKGFFLGLGAFATYCCNATVFYAAKEFILKFSLNFDDFMFTASTLMMMITGISVGLNGVSDYPKAKRAFISVFKTMRTQSLIPPFLRDNEGKIVPENLRGKIEFRNVTFAYPTKPDIDVLKNVSFVIEPGQSAGLVGYSGCGKSTIIQLIERFYDVEDGFGEVLIDDINVKDYNLYLLRKKIGLVSQEPVLFKRSVYENILYGRLDASREEVLSAAKAAVIEKFFDKKQMGTKEDPVSGGEKQRLAIARAFLKDPIILLLDEATSALDKESEKGVQASIDVLQKGRTSVAVAHRLSTIQNSDVILVMENGKLVEKGTHEELLALGKKYANLYKYSEQ